MRVLLLLPVVILSSCPPIDPGPLPGPDDDDDATLPACDPALTLTPSVDLTVPFGLVSFVAEGGTGDYRFELVQDPSGALVNDLTGAYLAGETAGVIDVVRVTDGGCDGSVEASIEVVTTIEIVPDTIVVPPGTTFTFEVVGGSGEFDCQFVSNAGGGTLKGCTWSGPEVGTGSEVVRATDLRTAATADAWVQVDPDAALELGATRLYLPLGAPYTLSISGGSGFFEGETLSGTGIDVDFDTVTLTAESEGTTRLRFVDRFAGLSVDVTAVGVGPHPLALDAFGNQELGGEALAPGDVTGNGFDDVLLSFQEADVAAANGGAVFLYEGTGDGFAAEPARIWAGTSWDDEMGRAITVGDFDGDGVLDLAIGITRDDSGGSDAGAVEIYPGLLEGGFTEAASVTVLGNGGSRQSGAGLTACDFNADGFDDLAIGAPRAEDSTAIDPANNSGAVAIHRGGPDGAEPSPARTLLGVLPEDDGWSPSANAYLGRHLAAGDFDGDGYCDLAAASYEHTVAETGASQDGAVWIWHGGPDGIEADPRTLLVADPDLVTGSNFGRALAVGDLDDDGLDDLVVGERYSSYEANRSGAVHVFLGRADWGPPRQRGWEIADWSVFGNGGYDSLGMDLQLTDFNGDGVLDLLVGAPSDEPDDGPSNTGAVLVFIGTAGGLPGSEPTAAYYGASDGDWFGQQFAAVGDLDGDGHHDLLVLAGREASLGWNHGRPFALGGGPDSTPVPLDFDYGPSGTLVGRGLGFADLDADGDAELVIGAPMASWADNRITTGSAWRFEPTGPGAYGPDALDLGQHPTAAGSDNFGWAVGSAGDFDGDGFDDLAVVAEADEAPDSLEDGGFADPSACGGQFPGGGAGAMYLFGGSADGPSATPAFAWFGHDNRNGLMSLGGGADINGDGRADLLVGSVDHDGDAGDDLGAIHLLLGRASDPAGTTVACEADWTWEGLGGGDRAGRSVAAIGDLNGDGCDETAFGAGTEDLEELNNRGIVRVLWGWGGAGCPSAPAFTTLGMPQSNALLGWSLDGGHDVDGDGVPDLAVGAPDWNSTSTDTGAAWVVPGSYLADLPTEPVDTASPTVLPLVPEDGTHWRIDGWFGEEELGRGVALVPGLSADGRAGLVAGGRHASYSGVYDSGGARIHEFHLGGDSPGFGPEPWAVLGGEAPAGFFGEACAATEGAVAVSGERADGLSVDAGAVYILPLHAFDE